MLSKWTSALLLGMGFLLMLPALAQTKTEKMESLINPYVINKQFMGAILVAQGDEIILNKGYGYANLEWNISNAPATKFRLASLTKQFTAASIFLLEQQGKLKTTDFITKYFSDMPVAWNKITINNLLTHSSGIPDITSLPEYEYFQLLPTTALQTIQIFRDKALNFKPGEKVSYSSSGYIILGALIEKISGKAYASFLQENIFSPINMTSSGYELNSEILEYRATGYVPGVNGFNNASFIDMSVPHAAGAIYSTTEDLLKWENALFGKKLLSAASLKKMITPFKEDYASGLFVAKNNGHTVIRHGGDIQGFNTSLSYHPDRKITVAVLGNVNTYAVEEIANALTAIARGEEFQAPVIRMEINVPIENLKRYVGSYELSLSANMIITLDGNHLISQVSNQKETASLFAETDTRFFVKAFDAQLEFFENEDHEITHLTLHQFGNTKKAFRH